MNKSCPNDEIIACYAEGRLKGAALVEFEEHLKQCSLCAEIVIVQKECVLAREKGEFVDAPPALFERLRKELVDSRSLLEIVITFKEKIIEAIRTTGEFMPIASMQPAYALRGAGEAGDLVVIREVFGTTQVVVEISKQGADCFRAVLKVADVQTTLPREDLRVNLLQGETELESNKTIGGRVVMEGLKAGGYSIQMVQKDQIVGNIKMSLKSI